MSISATFALIVWPGASTRSSRSARWVSRSMQGWFTDESPQSAGAIGTAMMMMSRRFTGRNPSFAAEHGRKAENLNRPKDRDRDRLRNEQLERLGWILRQHDPPRGHARTRGDRSRRGAGRG